MTTSNQRTTEQHARAKLAAVVNEVLDDMNPQLSQAEDYRELVEEVEEAATYLAERLYLLHVRGEELVAGPQPPGLAWPVVDEREWMTETVPFRGDSLVIGLSVRESQARLSRQAWQLGLLALGVVLVTTLGCWILVGITLSPIDRLTRQAQKAGNEGLETRLASPSEDRELKQLVETFNRFLDRLSQSAEARSRFYASASHELRTPLQALSGHLELALSKPRNEEQYRATLEEARTQTRRLIRLTGDLLALNRLEQNARLSSEPLDLAELCENQWFHFKERAQERKLRVHLDLPETLTVVAPVNLVEMLVRNLLENAVKYTPEEGKVDLSVAAHPPTLQIQNDSSPILAEDFERLFEPFFRPDPARTSRTGGNGLGLPIARSIAEQQGWHLELQQIQGRFLASVVFASLESL